MDGNIDIALIVQALGTRDTTILMLQTQVAAQGQEITRLMGENEKLKTAPSVVSGITPAVVMPQQSEMFNTGIRRGESSDMDSCYACGRS